MKIDKYLDKVRNLLLPDGWVWVALSDVVKDESYAIVDGPFGSSLKVSDYIEDPIEGIPVLQGKNITGNQFQWKSIRFISRRKAETLARSKVRVGDVLLIKIGSIGYSAEVRDLKEYDYAIIPANLCKISPDPTIISLRYLLFVLQSSDSVNYMINSASATAQPALSLTKIKNIPVPLAPLNEQRHIVEALEALFSRLDAGIAALKRAQANLKRYKASVLKAACEGKLVPQDQDDEPASELLARILAERRAKWEAEELAKYEAKGKKPPKNWRDKYPEPQPPDTSDLPELPEGWVWASFEEILAVLKNGYFGGRPESEPPGIPILRIGAVRPLSVDLSDIGYLPEFDEKMSEYFLNDGDLLFIRYNGNLHLVGACGIVQGMEEQLLYPDKLIRAVMVNPASTFPRYLEFYFATPFPRHIIEDQAVSTAGQNGISGTTLRAIPVALPPTSEQKRIVEEVDSLVSLIDSMDLTIKSNLQRAERLRQSILKEAFAGRLVPQDPDDEPASVLLERIRAEREQRR